MHHGLDNELHFSKPEIIPVFNATSLDYSPQNTLEEELGICNKTLFAGDKIEIDTIAPALDAKFGVNKFYVGHDAYMPHSSFWMVIRMSWDRHN
jgi:hypothetical protein